MAPASPDRESIIELAARLGDIPADRILANPAPGTATEADVVRFGNMVDKRMYELIRGVLVGKPGGMVKGVITACLGSLVSEASRRLNSGLALSGLAAYRTTTGNIRIPDFGFVSWDQLPEGRVPNVEIADFSPALAIDVVMNGNTVREMWLKREEYFASGTQLAWEANPDTRTVRMYTGVHESVLLTGDDRLTGGAVLPGFSVPVRDVFGDLDRRR